MQLEISKDEYKTLIEMIYIADWVIHAHKIEEKPATKKYKGLIQKIYSYAEKFGFKNLIEYDEKFKEYFPSSEFEEGEYMEYIDEYNNDTFWDELIERLVVRDVIRQEGEKKYYNMNFEERITKEDPFREKYYAEFIENGLENVEVKL